MELIFSDSAEEDLDEADQTLRSFFVKHAEKIALMPPGRHMRFGLPFNVEEVTRQARIVYSIEKETCIILRCFATHKEYERWYKSFK